MMCLHDFVIVVPVANRLRQLADCLDSLAGLSEQQPHTPCRYHGHAVQTGDAAYHDMADLFGYSRPAAMPYRCPVEVHTITPPA